MKRFACIVVSFVLCLGCSVALALESATIAPSAVNPENYPYFYITSIAKADVSSPVVISGCFGDFKETGDDSGADLQTLGFDETKPVDLTLTNDCEVLLPTDLLDNIMENVPCGDILQWYQTQNEDPAMPFTFYAVLTLNESNQVTKLAYQYFPWG